MAIPTVNQNNFGLSVPNTFVMDVAQLQEIDLDPAFKELLVRLYQNLGLMCNALNKKTGGYYPSNNQFITGNSYFPDAVGTGIATGFVRSDYRPSFRVLVNFGTLPNAGLKSVPHGITVTANTTWVMIQGWATDPVGLTGIPIPYASSTAASIVELYVDATNVNVITNGDLTNYTTTLILLEFMNQ